MMIKKTFYSLIAGVLIIAGITVMFFNSGEQKVLAIDTGYKSPTATGGTYNQWINPTNAYTSNNIYATTDSNDFQDYYNFSFGIPEGATINGILVEYEGKTDGTAIIVKAVLSWNGGSTWTSTKQTIWGGFDTYMVYGGLADTWGRTWSSTEFADGTFKVEAYHQNSSETISIDHIRVKVDYTEVAGADYNPNLNRVIIIQ